jgi:peroxiredoxin (alkyl hydroperoxide reductase subunit C)
LTDILKGFTFAGNKIELFKQQIIMSVLIGKKAPVFKAKAVVNGSEMVDNFSLEQYLGKKYVVFFFYPADFTFVCPTELIAFQEKLAEFKSRNVAVVGASTDSVFSHLKWLQTNLNEGGVKGVNYPLVSDQALTISANYDVLAGATDYTIDGDEVFAGLPQAYRGLFLIDKDGVVRHQVVNDMPLGRSIDETLRMIDALQFTEAHGEVCPANWAKGKEALKATQTGVSEYLSKKC